MKKSFSMFFLLFFMLSCVRNESKTASVNILKKEAMDIAVKYAKAKFKEAKETVAKDGIVTVTDSRINFVAIVDNQLKYIIDPAKIVVGLIDDDTDEDAIITIFSLKGQYMEMPESLILINTDGKLELNRALESDMKIMGIKNREIIAEVSTVSPDSPGYGCAECKEVVRYRYTNGDLVKVE